MKTVAADGVSIAFDDHGRGEPALLLLPAWCSPRTAFEDLAPLCAEHRRTLVLDWRGHGDSNPPTGDFGAAALVEDALAVIRASGAHTVVPVALSHAGWVAIELRQRLGDRIPRVVLLDWLVSEPSTPYREALQGMQVPERQKKTIDEIFSLWLHGVDQPRLTQFVRQQMGSFGFEMWARAAREISAAYRRAGSPLHALAALRPPVPALHLYAQPDDAGYLQAQQSFAAEHPWFHVQKLHAQSHFPMFEVAGDMAMAIERFAGGA